MKTMDQLALQCKEGLIDRRQAAFGIMDYIRRNKGQFGLQKWSSDECDDFLFSSLPRIEKMLEKYDPSQALFSTFFSRSFGLICISYRKKLASLQADRGALDCVQALMDEEKAYGYAQSEGALSVECACAEEERRKQVGRLLREKHSYLMNTRRPRCRRSRRDENLEKLRREACLILFLKSSAVSDDSSIRNTSIVTGISEDRLFGLREQLRDRLFDRLNRRRLAGKARDDAFYFRRKYRLQIERLAPGSRFCQMLLHCYEQQSRRWKKSLGRLEGAPAVAPSNREVGELLNLSERRVAYVMRTALRKLDQIRLRSVDES